jgi:hypothetical protein
MRGKIEATLRALDARGYVLPLSFELFDRELEGLEVSFDQIQKVLC